MTAIIDYGVGNLFSLQSSLHAIGEETIVTSDETQIAYSDRVILPGVGAFGDAMKKLYHSGADGIIKKIAGQGKPLLGICLGMQLLFEYSEEFGIHDGLGLLRGKIISFESEFKCLRSACKVPHMGWDTLTVLNRNSPIVKHTGEEESFYYVHSYFATECDDSLVAVSEYGLQVPGVVQMRNVFGTQFHPEKSGKCGLAMLKAFVEVNQ